mgnify:CR=1 FL=1
MDNKKINRGQIRAIRGSVVDAFFPQLLPKINYQLKAGEAIIEVTLHLDANTVRGIALTPTQGLKRGDEIIDMGHPLQVPVGRGLLGRMFNVFGEPIDGGKSFTAKKLVPIYKKSLSLAERTTTADIYETGIKVIDVLAPLEKGGKIQISALQIDNKLMLSVSNPLMTETEKNRFSFSTSQKGNQMAQDNIRQRLKLVYGDSGRFTINDTKEKYTVSLIVPLDVKHERINS